MVWTEQQGISFWSPQTEGDELVGEVTGINTEAQFGTQHVIKDEKGKEHLTPSHKFLQSRLARVKVSQMVKLVYKGEDTENAKKGRSPTKMYQVFIDE